MEKTERNVPKVRFPGFADPWEQCKLSDVTESIKNGYIYKADGSRDHRYKITRIESISSGVINTEKLGSSDEVNENYRLVDGDILFSHINSLPYIANTALYTADLGEIYHGMNLLNIRSKHKEIDSHFLLHLLKKESTRGWFRIIAKPAVNQASISITEVGSFEFLIPRVEEQKKISSVLDNLDNLIALHQRELANLETQKKAVMKKIFSQEVRFKRADGSEFPEWEEDVVGNRCKIQTGKSNTQDAVDEGAYPFYVRSPQIYRSNRFLFDTEAVITVGDGVGTGKVYHYVEGKFDLHQRAYAMTDFVGMIGRYFYYYFSSFFYDRVHGMTAKTSVDSVRYEMIDKMVIMLPCLEEQRLIADFLSNFDEAIAAAKKELELWKELKKGLLQQMFV